MIINLNDALIDRLLHGQKVSHLNGGPNVTQRKLFFLVQSRLLNLPCTDYLTISLPVQILVTLH